MQESCSSIGESDMLTEILVKLPEDVLGEDDNSVHQHLNLQHYSRAISKTLPINLKKETLQLKKMLMAANKEKEDLHYFNLCLYSIIKNITQSNKKHADITLACKTSTLSEIASAFAHEINQPLTAITAYSRSCLNIIKNNPASESTFDKLLLPLEQITTQAEYMGKVIHNMKNLMDDGSLSVEKTNVNSLIKETLSILKYEYYDFKFKLVLNLMKKIPRSLINKMYLMQIILNLTRNSIEALKDSFIENPEIKIITSISAQYIIVDIMDNGPGISLENQKNILNLCFTTKSKGNGIGLGICRSLIEALGGELSLNQATQTGAWFRFTLPIIKEA